MLLNLVLNGNWFPGKAVITPPGKLFTARFWHKSRPHVQPFIHPSPAGRDKLLALAARQRHDCV
jgi:hypothetical protein